MGTCTATYFINAELHFQCSFFTNSKIYLDLIVQFQRALIAV